MLKDMDERDEMKPFSSSEEESDETDEEVENERRLQRALLEKDKVSFNLTLHGSYNIAKLHHAPLRCQKLKSSQIIQFPSVCLAWSPISLVSRTNVEKKILGLFFTTIIHLKVNSLLFR